MHPRAGSAGARVGVIGAARRAGMVQVANGAAPGPLPKLVAFDLDATLWYPEMYMLEGPPFRADTSRGVVYDRSQEAIRLIGDVREVLGELATQERWAETQVAYVSRTEYPQWADKCLKLFELEDGLTLHTLGVQKEIYPGSKRTHFRALQQRTKIDYKDCLFFDDDSWNIKEVSQLGVTCVYTPNGLTKAAWEQGLKLFAQQATKRRERAAKT